VEQLAKPMCPLSPAQVIGGWGSGEEKGVRLMNDKGQGSEDIAKPENPLDNIPSAAEVRARLKENLQEAKILRSLLRVAERAERDRRNRTDVNPGEGG
jgi:hypothetical protein